ncbi:MAG: amidase family protein, partial [Xanthobacteraceae bacterium]
MELTRACLDRIAKLNPELNAFISSDEERETSLAAARRADAQRASGNAGPLTGIPLAHKDILCTRDFRTTCGSRMLENYRSPYDAHVVQELERAGAVVTGKTNMDEFAMG